MLDTLSLEMSNATIMDHTADSLNKWNFFQMQIKDRKCYVISSQTTNANIHFKWWKCFSTINMQPDFHPYIGGIKSHAQVLFQFHR